jgi:ATP-dependent exoDNAse (exonuclease V) alpha subunit
MSLISSRRKELRLFLKIWQLPPVSPDADNHLLDNPHIVLTQIMRQEEGSEIIQLTTAIREGRPIDYFKGNEVQVIPKEELSTGMLQWADIVLTATNKTRYNLNMQMRELRGFRGGPKDGDKIICKRNYWDVLSEENALVNGTIGYLRNPHSEMIRLPQWMTNDPHEREITNILADFVSENGDTYSRCLIDKKMIMKEQPCLSWKTKYKALRSKTFDFEEPMEFMYGYAVTGWAAQGSQWGKVVVLEENFPYDKEEHKKFLYTCCTRATDKLVLVINK